MKLKILGSGAWEGIPAPFCNCIVCKKAINNPQDKNNRTRPEILIESDEGKFLLEVSPDIRLQAARFNLPFMRDYIISHWHFDHMYGLKELEAWIKYSLKENPTIYCSPETKKVIDKELSYIPLSIHTIQPFQKFTLYGIEITALPLYHMRALDDEIPEDKIKNAYGYLLEYKGKSIAYLGDYYKVPGKTFDKIRDVDILIADGTYLLTDDYKSFKPNHMHGKDILEFTKSTKAKQVFFHSISHLTQLSHDELQSKLPPSHFITFDGMEILLSGNKLNS